MAFWTADTTDTTSAVQPTPGSDFMLFLQIGIDGHRSKMQALRSSLSLRLQTATGGQTSCYSAPNGRCFSL